MMKDSFRKIRKLISTASSGESRSSRYYHTVIAPDGGGPTYDEARRDLSERDRATTVLPLPH